MRTRHRDRGKGEKGRLTLCYGARLRRNTRRFDRRRNNPVPNLSSGETTKNRCDSLRKRTYRICFSLGLAAFATASIAAAVVELPGFEPRTTEPKSAVLPLHHSSNIRSKATAKIYKKSQNPIRGTKNAAVPGRNHFAFILISLQRNLANISREYDNDNDSALRGGLPVHRAGA